MSEKLSKDLADMEEKLSLYMEKGRVTGYTESREEPSVSEKPDPTKIIPLKKISRFNGQFLAVDCSTRTLKRAHNWGIYFMRVAYALVRGKDADWGYDEKICTEIGDAHARGNVLTHKRMELESGTALKLLCDENTETNHKGCSSRRNFDKGDYILLDGPSFFGGERRFQLSLYEKCLRKNINLLCISKQSPTLHDEIGRDFIATTYGFSSHPIWVYYPIERADEHKHLYGDVSVVKLCEDSLRAFRCDIMGYLTNRQMDELLSPLTSVSKDPRCLGYPVPLWLAHDFSAPSDAQLLHYLDRVEKALAKVGILGRLQREELSCNFADEIHGIKYPYHREMVGGYV